MFERFRRHPSRDESGDRDSTATAVRDREAPPRERDRSGNGAPETTAGGGLATREAVREARARQRERFGGYNWGAAFFGWLVALGLAALLTGILAAAGAALGLTEVTSDTASGDADTIGLAGGAALVAIVMLAYFAGGYVAGRMSRFDGARQGFGVWIFGLLVAIVLAVLGAVAGSEYNVFERLDLPRIPVDEGTLTTGGAIALAAVVVGTLIAALLGGKLGERYHRRVDRAAIVE
jgi:MFS family permease